MLHGQLLISMFNIIVDFTNIGQWLSVQKKYEEAIARFCETVQLHQLPTLVILGAHPSMWTETPLPDLYVDIQTDIIAQFRSRGVQAYTGMEDHIGFSRFKGKLDNNNHIRGVHRDLAVSWLEDMLTLVPDCALRQPDVNPVVHRYASYVPQLPEPVTSNPIRPADAASMIDALPLQSKWVCHKTATEKTFNFSHTRKLKSPTTFSVSIQGCSYHAEYLGHGQHKAAHRLSGPVGSVYDGKVLKLSDLEQDTEPVVFTQLKSHNVITPILACGVCSYINRDTCNIDSCVAWVTELVQPLDAALEDTLAVRYNMILGALRALLLAADHGDPPLIFPGKTDSNGSSRAKVRECLDSKTNKRYERNSNKYFMFSLFCC
jgi:hypothetical protein